jgi:hypothetical protein
VTAQEKMIIPEIRYSREFGMLDSRESGNEKQQGIPGARETGARE